MDLQQQPGGTYVPARPDRTLSLKRTMFRALYRASDRTVVERIATRFIAPDAPQLALALGERLVRTPRRVLALTAHPDDLEFFCGGTLRRMADAGSRIHAVVLSDGEKRGNWIDLGGQRRSEQEKAGKVLGYRSITFEGLPDFGLPEDPRLEMIVARAWDRVAPEVVLAFDAKELVPGIANRDHKALGRTVMDLSRARFHTGAEVYFYGTHSPDTLVDITDVFADKLKAATSHRSQMVYLDAEKTEATFRLMGRIAAAKSGAAYAEPLYRLM